MGHKRTTEEVEQSYNKIENSKNIIKKLYIEERKSKVYIANLLEVPRQDLTYKINNDWAWDYNNPKFDMKPSTRKFINKHKQKIISLFNQGLNIHAVSKELGLGNDDLIRYSCIKYDKDINKAYYSSIKSNQEAFNTHLQELPGEEWKDILGYDGLYKISNFGRVSSFINETPILVKPGFHTKENRYLIAIGAKGYPKKTFRRARLVAHAFCPNDDKVNKNTVDHIDGDSTNDVWTNLEWVSQGENNKRAYSNGRAKVKSFSKYGRNNIFIVNDKYEFKTVAAVAKFIHKSETQTRRIIDGEVKNLDYQIVRLPKM